MKLRMKLMMALFIWVVLLSVGNFVVSADESLDESAQEDVSTKTEDIYELDLVEHLSIWEVTADDETKVIYVGWNELSNELDNVVYELCLYQSDGNMVGSPIEIFFQNNSANENAIYPSENWDYEYRFSEILEDGLYYCTIRVSSDIEDSDGNIKTIYSDYTQSQDIKIEYPVPLTLKIDTQEWTNNTTPKITWEGVFVDGKEPNIIQYQINDGAWTDSEWTSSSGSGTFSEETFKSDGTYTIKIRGLIKEIESETQDEIISYSQESETVLYKRDADSPIVKIASPKTLDEFENTIKISASIRDGGSGIDSWQLEYENNNNIGVWEIFAFGRDEVKNNTVLTNWDVSSLPLGLYNIRLTVTDNDANKSQSSICVTIAVADHSAPVPPTEVSAILTIETDASAHIFWVDEINRQDVTYNLYRGTGIDFETAVLYAEDIEGTSYIDNNILYDREYYYWVSTKTLDRESKLSECFATVNLHRMLGLEDYWTYCSIETTSGKGDVNLANGNFIYSTSEINCSDSILNTILERIYNAQSAYLSPIGYGWDFLFNITLLQEKDSYNNLLGMIIKDGDGSFHYFKYDYETGGYIPPKGTFMSLEYSCKTGEHILTTKDNTSYLFDDSLKLTTMQDPNDNIVTFTYDMNDRLITIASSEEESYGLSYYQNEASENEYYTEEAAHNVLLAEITDNSGNSYTFIYKDGLPLLHTVLNTDSTVLETYEYTDKTHYLVTISDTEELEDHIIYTQDGKVESLILSDERVYTFDYLANETNVIDTNEEYTKYCFNTDGCLSSLETFDGNKITYIYNNNFQITKIKYEEYINDSLETWQDTFRYDEITGELINNVAPDAQQELQSDIN